MLVTAAPWVSPVSLHPGGPDAGRPQGRPAGVGHAVVEAAPQRRGLYSFGPTGGPFPRASYHMLIPTLAPPAAWRTRDRAVIPAPVGAAPEETPSIQHTYFLLLLSSCAYVLVLLISVQTEDPLPP